MLTGLLLLVLGSLVGSVLEAPMPARVAAGLGLVLIALGAAVSVWADGSGGVIRGRAGRVEVREAGTPYTFAASVAFHLLVWLVLAAAGVWLVMSAFRP